MDWKPERLPRKGRTSLPRVVGRARGESGGWNQRKSQGVGGQCERQGVENQCERQGVGSQCERQGVVSPMYCPEEGEQSCGLLAAGMPSRTCPPSTQIWPRGREPVAPTNIITVMVLCYPEARATSPALWSPPTHTPHARVCPLF